MPNTTPLLLRALLTPVESLTSGGIARLRGVMEPSATQAPGWQNVAQRRRTLRTSITLGAATAMLMGSGGLLAAAAPLLEHRPVNPAIERIAGKVANPLPVDEDRVAVPPPAEEKPATDPTEHRAVPAASVEPANPATQLPLPAGKGMWIWLPERADGGDPAAIVARAKAAGLTHFYVRTGSSRSGLHGTEFLDRVLPAAHEAGLRVYGWDFPYLDDWGADVNRAVAAIRHTAPGGHQIDGFVADIETPSEGTVLTAPSAAAYGTYLRQAVGAHYPLIVAVPRPSDATIARYPFDVIVKDFTAIAPMVYWLNRQPDTDVAHALQWLSRYGKPLIPIGQAYDGAPEGGRPGVPSRDELHRFMRAAEAGGAVGVSFWSWQHATQEAWDAIRDAGEFNLRAAPPAELRPPEVTAVQVLLGGLGYPTPVSGAWDDATTQTVTAFQRDAGLRPTGRLNEATRSLMLEPVRVPRP